MPHIGRDFIVLAQDDGDPLVQRDAVTESLAAVFIGLERLLHQRIQRRLEILRRLIQADDVFIVGLHRHRDFALEQVNRHAKKINHFARNALKFQPPHMTWIQFSNPGSFAAWEFDFRLGPNSAVPIRTSVAPSSIAISKSPLMPMLKWGKGAPSADSARSLNSRSRRKYGRDLLRLGRVRRNGHQSVNFDFRQCVEFLQFRQQLLRLVTKLARLARDVHLQ